MYKIIYILLSIIFIPVNLFADNVFETTLLSNKTIYHSVLNVNEQHITVTLELLSPIEAGPLLTLTIYKPDGSRYNNSVYKVGDSIEIKVKFAEQGTWVYKIVNPTSLSISYSLSSVHAPLSQSDFDILDTEELLIQKMGKGFSFSYDTDINSCKATLNFKVKNQNNSTLMGLDKDNFIVKEDDYEVDPSIYFDMSKQDVLNIFLLIDVSASILEYGFDSYLKQSLNYFVEAIGDRGNFSYYKFASEVTKIDSLSSLAFSENDLFTSVYDAVYKAVEDGTEAGQQPVILVFTDGKDNHSLYTLDEVVALVKSYNLFVYAIGIGDVDTQALKDISSTGEVYFIDTFDEISTAFSQIAEFINNIYTVSYWSPSRQGKHDLEFIVNLPQQDANEFVTENFDIIGEDLCAKSSDLDLNISIIASSTMALSPAQIDFTLNIQGGVEPYTVSWDFGDGSTDQETSVSHEFTSMGNYTVTASVIDSMENSITQSIDMLITGSMNDSDGDGVIDEWDECSDSSVGIPVLADGCAESDALEYPFLQDDFSILIPYGILDDIRFRAIFDFYIDSDLPEGYYWKLDTSSVIILSQ